MVKHKLTNKCNLVDLYRLITSVESKTIERTLVEGKREVKLIIHNPILKELYHVYSRWAFEQMLYQFMNSHQLFVKNAQDKQVYTIRKTQRIKSELMRESEDGIYTVKDYEQKEKFQVIVRLDEEGVYQTITCNCKYMWSHDLYCSHIFAVFNSL
jgi:hypothetical protein